MTPTATVAISIDLLQLAGAVVGLVVGLLGVVYGFGRLLINQFTLRLDERFQSRDESQSELEQDLERVEHQLDVLQRDQLMLRAQLPTEYVRREDWIRFSGTIDAKLDWLREKFDLTGQHIAQLMERVKSGSKTDGG